MDRYIDDIEFTIFDTETTGLNPDSGDRIVEIAGLRVKGQKVLGKFHSFINSPKEISPAAFAVNHITREMLENSPAPEVVLDNFLNFIKGSCLCSYNAAFDMGFIENELVLSGRGKLNDIIVIDILKMAKRLLPGMERYALWFVSQKMQVNMQQEHRAFSDAQIALEVFNKFKDMLYHKGIFSFSNFVNLFGINLALLEDMNNSKIAKIQEAIGLGASIKINYLSSVSAELTEREITPKEIRRERGHSYMVGYCSLRKDERTFRVDSILHLEIL